MDVYDATAPEYKTLKAIREVIFYVEKNIAKLDIGRDCMSDNTRIMEMCRICGLELNTHI